MTISSETCEVTFSGNDVTTIFPFSFIIPYQADGVTPAVYAFTTTDGADTALILGTDYSISGVGDSAGGEVTKTSALATGTTLTIQRAVEYVQPYVFLEQSFRPAEIEAAFDWVVMQMQQLNRRLTALEG